MSTLILVFISSLLLVLAISPVVRILGCKLGALDSPGPRKIHQDLVPRMGGLSIFLVFNLTLLGLYFIDSNILNQAFKEHSLFYFLLGALICFSAGFWDDLRRLSPFSKLILQTMAAIAAYAGGLFITHFIALPFNLDISNYIWINLPITIFWYLLIINAVNLVDGLDGLAAGITLFTSLVMIIFLILTKDLTLALLFALLGGVAAGFLPYNFKQTGKMFLGDSGSYFLGYCIATFSIMGSIKGQVGATLLIPLLVMGLPVFEAIFSPIRRVILAQNPLEADKGHVHHRLLRMGFSMRKAVLILYALTLALGLYSIVLINIKIEKFGLFFAVLVVMVFIFMKVVGYFNYIDREKFKSWLGDFSFVTGVAKDRRRFLNLQVAVTESKDLEELWSNICGALLELDMDFAEINLGGNHFSSQQNPGGLQKKAGLSVTQKHDKDKSDLLHKTSDILLRKTWTQNGFMLDTHGCKRNLFKLELPLHMENQHLGELWVIKDLSRSPINHYTLTRIEHLRRSISRTLRTLAQNRIRPTDQQ